MILMYAVNQVTLPPAFASMMIPHLKNHPRSSVYFRDLSQVFCRVQQPYDGTRCNSCVDPSTFPEFWDRHLWKYTERLIGMRVFIRYDATPSR